jgi:hypothetical protein
MPTMADVRWAVTDGGTARCTELSRCPAKQDQWSLLLLLRMAHHGMTLQQAIDAPAFHTTHVPSSFAPRGRGFLFAGANPRGQPATARFLAERKLTAAPPDVDAQDLFEFYLERCLWTQTSGHGEWNPRHTIWRSG